MRAPVHAHMSCPLCQHGRSNLCPQQSRAGLGVMVAVDTIFDEAPCSVDHLRATLDSDLLPTWQGMLLELHEDRVLPRPLALDLDTLLLVNHGVVKDTRNLCLVGAGTVSVEDDVLLSQPFLSNWLPCNFASCTGC